MRRRPTAAPVLTGLAACLTAAALVYGCREVTRAPSTGPSSGPSLEVTGTVTYPTVTIVPHVDSLLVGDTITLRAQLHDPAQTPDTTWWGRCVEWSTSDSTVVAVDFTPSGAACVPATDTAGKPVRLLGEQAGVAVITATTLDGTAGSDTIRVVEPPPPPISLTVAGGGSGSGTVTSTPSGINCTIAAGVASGACTANFPADTAVTLAARADGVSAFTGWGGACGGVGFCTVTARGASAVSAAFAARTGAALAGEWTQPFKYSSIAVHLHLMPNDQVLSWSRAPERYIWDLRTGTAGAAAQTVVPSPSNDFCAGHNFLADGRLLVTGGHVTDGHGLPNANLFNPTTQTFTAAAPMKYARWYPTSATLPNGEILTVGGTDENGNNVAIPEIWNPTTGAWRSLTTASREHYYYPKLFVAPNAKVFMAGESPTTRYLSTAGTGAWSTVGTTKYGRRDYGSAVMYEPGKVLILGGGGYAVAGTVPTKTAEVIDLNKTGPAWRYTGSMQHGRRHLNATLLADGTVLATGGTSSPGKNNWDAAVFAAEIWDPTTEKWRTLASAAEVRVYHSSAILLPDGRVLSAGGGDAPHVPPPVDQYVGEIFSPPYLFNPDGSPATRPTITTAPATMGFNKQFTVKTPDAASITAVTLLRLGSATHGFNHSQRFNRLTFKQTTDGLTVTSPASSKLAQPGYYLLFIATGSGVPSVAATIQLR